jgi:hypothetical protein
VEWPSSFDPWGFWMAFLKSSFFKLHDLTGNDPRHTPNPDTPYFLAYLHHHISLHTISVIGG